MNATTALLSLAALALGATVLVADTLRSTQPRRAETTRQPTRPATAPVSPLDGSSLTGGQP